MLAWQFRSVWKEGLFDDHKICLQLLVIQLGHQYARSSSSDQYGSRVCSSLLTQGQEAGKRNLYCSPRTSNTRLP